MIPDDVAEVVTRFTSALIEERVLQLARVQPSFADSEAAAQLADAPPPHDWLRLALYGQNLSDEDDGEMRDVAHSLAESIFGIPGHSAYTIPEAWAATPMGALWWAAVLRTEGDALITLAEAATLAGTSIAALSQRMRRGGRRTFTNPAAPNPQKGRTLVRRTDVLALVQGGNIE